MSLQFDQALRLTEILCCFALLQQSFENISLRKTKINSAIQFCQILLCVLLFFASRFELWILLVGAHLLSLQQFRGNLNGASDAMTTLTLFSLLVLNTFAQAREFAFVYLCVQVILSYFVSGFVKLRQAEWPNGKALGIFLQSAFYKDDFPGKFLQVQSLHRPLACLMIFWEISFILAYIFPKMAVLYLIIGFMFHLFNALVFGLHRFFWAWIATYPLLYVFLTTT